MHRAVCEPLKNWLLYGLIPGNLINRAGKGEIKKTGGTNEIQEAAAIPGTLQF